MILLHDIDPVAFGIGPLQVRWYGVMYAIGFGVAWWLGNRRVRAGWLPGVNAQAFGDLLFYAMLGVVLGGRIGYVFFYVFDDLLKDPLMLFRTWEGGMSFHGGLIGVVVACWWWSRKHRLHLFDTVDFVAPLVPPGLGLGRLGNYIGGELFGKPTEAGWGVVFPQAPEFAGWSADQVRAEFATGALDQFARHPSQLYQAALEGLVMFVVLWWFSSRPRPRYAVSGMFALLYGCFRFLVEFVRVPDQHIGYLAFDWLTMGQVLSLPLIGLGLFWLWLSRRSPIVARA
ncbi:prolipoprotein diacylglyceryl transferase [Aerolutibacter ruishenii]|uniref:Phosphatidylglycerol--prolipoprotein diacylglyceryl transferase n=1 Tax=Aerolutibacter ruishenii TaxID=686800 RepID=A0A562M397_9GAMM|nr:prolipoprotein diacylglyceryl transferase [Lysobacter ruishenii]TWI14071.1 phosphatidylglycerol:prolipoprotein diacylglycerol transferase [Lysobacter ruishenii]